jgi:phage FluMu gp28-like protein
MNPMLKSTAKFKARVAKVRKRKSPKTRKPNVPMDPEGQIQAQAVTTELLPIEFKLAVPVLPYQERWIKDESQLKVAVWSRQSGKSFAAALRATLKCLKDRTQYIILSKGERQSRLFMEKVLNFCQVLKKMKALPEFTEAPETDDKTMEVYFPHNGSRIIGLPANPDTARGYSGNIVLDEFAFHGDAYKIFAACFPIITRGYSIEVISTPNGTAGKFYEIAKAAGLTAGEVPGARCQVPGEEPGTTFLTPDTRHLKPSSLWSGHKVDIYDAVAQGLPANIDLLRAGCDDEETWLQEYGCQFLSDAQNYIPVELISTCVHEEATTEWEEVSGIRYQVSGEPGTRNLNSGPRSLTPDTRHLTPGDRELYMGVDIGRKRDLTIAWLFERVGGILWSRTLLTMKGVTFDEQEKIIFGMLDLGVRRAGIDASGLGMMLAEHAVQKYGAVVEPMTFTAQLKERLAPMVKQAFEERTVRIPDNREVRADINSVKRFVTQAGNVRFDAEPTDRGHADRFWALAQVINAATGRGSHPPSDAFEEVASLVGAPVMAGLMDAIL